MENRQEYRSQNTRRKEEVVKCEMVVIDAGMSLDRFNQIYQTSLEESDEVDTMAGAVSKLGYFPGDDEVVKVRFRRVSGTTDETENDVFIKIHKYHTF